jgi:hypothetical protein
VVCVGDEGDNDIDLGDFGIESIGIVDIELEVLAVSNACVGDAVVR